MNREELKALAAKIANEQPPRRLVEAARKLEEAIADQRRRASESRDDDAGE